jgi:hypothetical protein
MTNHLFNRAVAIAKDNGFEHEGFAHEGFYLYQPNYNESVFGLCIKPFDQRCVSIQVKELFDPLEASEPIILTNGDAILLEQIIRAFAFASLAVVRALKEE